ncbi:MAG: SpoVG family protein [Clostridia bacterium]|nr:SpoVG family protein [Clostridia bacterium]
MEITNVKIRKLFDGGPMKAIASITVDNALAIHDVKVIYAKDRYFVVMPSRKNPDGTFRDIVHPISTEFRAALEEAVRKAYFAEKEAAETAAPAESKVPADESAE